jgi:hypothetical protein
MDLQNSGTAQVDDVLTLEFNMPGVAQPIKITGKVREKDASGSSSIEFIDPAEAGREVIREFVYSRITE